MKIELDLRTDLAKVTPETLGDRNKCRYSAPCAVGAMMTPEQRTELVNTADGLDGDSLDTVNIFNLIHRGCVTVPEGQTADFVALQRAFDRSEKQFNTTLTALQEKYA